MSDFRSESFKTFYNLLQSASQSNNQIPLKSLHAHLLLHRKELTEFLKESPVDEVAKKLLEQGKHHSFYFIVKQRTKGICLTL
jgi:hypothetical protein